MKWLILLLGIAFNASASVLVKVAVTAPRKPPSFSEPLAALSNWPFWLGLSCYGAAFLLYAVSLTRLPLNVAHPLLTAGAIASVAVVSALMLREPFHLTTVAGLFFIIVGVVFITMRTA